MKVNIPPEIHTDAAQVPCFIVIRYSAMNIEQYLEFIKFFTTDQAIIYQILYNDR